MMYIGVKVVFRSAVQRKLDGPELNMMHFAYGRVLDVLADVLRCFEGFKAVGAGVLRSKPCPGLGALFIR